MRAACVVWFWEGERYRAVSGFFACPMPEHLVWGGYELGGATLKRPPPAKPAGGRQARPRLLGSDTEGTEGWRGYLGGSELA